MTTEELIEALEAMLVEHADEIKRVGYKERPIDHAIYTKIRAIGGQIDSQIAHAGYVFQALISTEIGRPTFWTCITKL